MALTDDQTAFFRQKLGEDVDLTDAETRLNASRNAGNQFKVVVEVLEQRIATYAAQPTSFSVDGYSQNTGTNITELRKSLSEAILDATSDEDLQPGAVRIVRPASRRRERFVRGLWP